MVQNHTLAQAVTIPGHLGQEICIESQEISVNIHVFDLAKSQIREIK